MNIQEVVLYYAIYIGTTDGPQAIFLLTQAKDLRRLVDPKVAGLLAVVKIKYICEFQKYMLNIMQLDNKY